MFPVQVSLIKKTYSKGMSKGKSRKKSNKKKPKPPGRPTKFKPEYEDQAYKLCLLGATDEELADFFGVSKSTLNLWKKRKRFSDSIKRGKIVANADVAESLYKRACGYEHTETKVFCSDGEIITEDVVKHYPPETAACMAFLKNRTRKQEDPWSDKQEVEHDVVGTLAEALHKANKK